MKIMLVGWEFAPDRYKGWHVLTAADGGSPEEAGESGRSRRDPSASVTTLPLWIVCDHDYARSPMALDEFRTHLARFVEMNRSRFVGAKVVINLHGAPRPLPSGYVTSIEDVFRSKAHHGSIREVVVYADLG